MLDLRRQIVASPTHVHKNNFGVPPRCQLDLLVPQGPHSRQLILPKYRLCQAALRRRVQIFVDQNQNKLLLLPEYALDEEPAGL